MYFLVLIITFMKAESILKLHNRELSELMLFTLMYIINEECIKYYYSIYRCETRL